jgi:hypothetical protein
VRRTGSSTSRQCTQGIPYEQCSAGDRWLKVRRRWYSVAVPGGGGSARFRKDKKKVSVRQSRGRLSADRDVTELDLIIRPTRALHKQPDIVASGDGVFMRRIRFSFI